ncbi:hypothetical protein BBO99_00001007 [Phytophthora kernoviae]|uniref:SMP-LTD domain-containing protein n=2 Tax=Phytophthora kernoviae TaxID=325452 RepID=A0A3F2S053_9STRA|nr:hypothetical protein G195_003602 [Phytophthora kernoviae 00238/432]KAG2508547.1 hypothetical protein JM16_008834 [Phytophthora kernoviae]KAG2531753.1 hypothetical protein JM18_000967 [Phytophthora kernoviae]RLN46482.1 hypothetical protein BBI17_000908 [Phytophthora kernoviae]RLN47481.1 hypothetical protein BBJ29_000630 [Phytophthora kernoviae]
MNTLSLVRMDLGTKTPHISGVKFVSANTLTDEVTLDLDVRVVTDKSFVAEIKMVSHLGAAVCLTLRELFLVGTLRITLHPLATYWPCFSAISLSFTTRPVFDFSLTAAKINFANVPFVSEWLHTFLYDLLINYFVWPKVVDIPLWDEQGNSYCNANI